MKTLLRDREIRFLSFCVMAGVPDWVDVESTKFGYWQKFASYVGWTRIRTRTRQFLKKGHGHGGGHGNIYTNT